MPENKEYKPFLIILIVLVVIFGVFRYLYSLKIENDILLDNIKRINERILRLESAHNIKEIMALKAENIVLKGQIDILKSEFRRAGLSISKPTAPKVEKRKGCAGCDKTSPGNRGLLTRCGKSSYTK